ncbi:MAG: ClbS/DfsB family four-helix bundle protein [Pseudomonadota bacterium]
MPAATSKTELLSITQRDYAKLDKLIGAIDGRVAERKREDDTSIKDVIAHRAHWIDLYLGWFEDGRAGRPVHIPAKGYKWNQLEGYNAALRAKQADLTWGEARSMLANAHARLTEHVQGLDDQALYGAPMTGSDKWTAGRFAEASGASHYRSAAKFVRAALRADAR